MNINSDQFKEYYNDMMSKQIEEMNIYKWIESEKAGYDLGTQALIDWINKYAKIFREKFDETYFKTKDKG